MNIYCYAIFIFFYVVFAQELIPCTTPNGETSTCVPLLNCFTLIQTAATKEPIALKFLNESVCDAKTSTVCCGTTGNYTIPKPLLNTEKKFEDLSKEEKRNFVLRKLLPTKRFCGLQHTDDYFYNGTETSVDEFPWLVYIIGKNIKEEKDYYLRIEANCAGVLISNRYVLTTQECVRIGYNGFMGMDILLGVHHIHKQINCIDTPFGVEDCTDPPLRVSSSNWDTFEETILLRLDNQINYSDYVRPICLTLQPDELPKAGDLVMVSGWSEEEFVEGKKLKLKKRMKYNVMKAKECEDGNPQKHPICGIPLRNNTHYICNGDIGGPLMYKHMERNWFAAGLIYQTERKLCNQVQPATAIQLTPEIVNWIIEKIKP